jgi:hypothetical protein
MGRFTFCGLVASTRVEWIEQKEKQVIQYFDGGLVSFAMSVRSISLDHHGESENRNTSLFELT